MPWLILFAAGLLEVAWASLLPATRGFTRLGPSVLLVVLLGLSLFGAALAARSIPIGTAYGVWVGIGTAGIAVVGVLAYGDPVTLHRVAFLVLLVVAIVGLRVTSPPH
jgi:quaternary ammonium compound-resistance protein SugE